MKKLLILIKDLALFSTLLVILFPSAVSALSSDQKALFDSGIYYFETNGSDSNTSCPYSGAGSYTAGAHSLDQVKTFASEPITSTWNISDSTVEQWFLKQAGAQATITKY